MLYSLCIYCFHTDIEYWTESDTEVDEDVEIESEHIPPPDILDVQESQERAELHMIVRWIMTLVSVFQTRFYLTDRSLNWLLKFIAVLLAFLGKFSQEIAEIASLIPQSINRCSDFLDNARGLFQ